MQNLDTNPYRLLARAEAKSPIRIDIPRQGFGNEMWNLQFHFSHASTPFHSYPLLLL